MTRWIPIFLGLVVFVVNAPALFADSDTENKVAKNCRTELANFCADVTPGKGRILACLYAYEDKASAQCRESVREAYDDIKLLSAAASHIENECGEDVAKFCSDITPGGGRIMNCLEKYEDKLSNKCTTALKEVGLRD